MVGTNVPVEIVKMEGEQGARVYHTIVNDPLWASYITLVEVKGDQVHVGTPLACGSGLSHLEIHSVVQLILGRAIIMRPTPVDTLVKFDDTKIREWKTYELAL